jgi:echinoderm microtubule-associated protein-like 6
MDWSSDGQTLMVLSQAYELMWLNMQTKKQLPASSAKQIQDDYHTFTNIFGWQVKGIWSNYSTDYSNINSTCRSHSRAVLATADDFGKVKLFRYPCVVESGSAQFNEYMGHSSHITKCKFSSGDNYLVTTGGHDKTVLIWETDFGTLGKSSQLP